MCSSCRCLGADSTCYDAQDRIGHPAEEASQGPTHSGIRWAEIEPLLLVCGTEIEERAGSRGEVWLNGVRADASAACTRGTPEAHEPQRPGPTPLSAARGQAAARRVRGVLRSRQLRGTTAARAYAVLPEDRALRRLRRVSQGSFRGPWQDSRRASRRVLCPFSCRQLRCAEPTTLSRWAGRRGTVHAPGRRRFSASSPGAADS